MKLKLQQDFDFYFNILVLGDSGVGKSMILLRFAYDTHSTSFVPTVGVDQKYRNLKIKEKSIKLSLWDASGSEASR